MKSFEVKTYTRAGVFKKNINPRNITSEISFSEDLDGGQSDLNLQIIGDFLDFLCTDIVEIREVDDENKQISRTYTGIIEEIAVTEFEKNDMISLNILGVFTALNDIIFKSGSNRTFTSTLSPGNMVKSIIDLFNTEYGALSGGQTQNLTANLIRYTVESIDTSGSSINIEFDNTTCIDAIKKSLENTGFNFFIGSDGVCYVQKDAGQESVSLTMGRQIISVERKLHKRDMVNKYYHERALNNEQTYTDPVSIALFGTKELFETDSEIQDATTQNTKGNQKIQDYAYERNEISLTMVPQKSSSIYPGMMLSVNNTKIALLNKKITKISKEKSYWTIYVGDFISFGNTIIKK